jgi:hypothetical protein
MRSDGYGAVAVSFPAHTTKALELACRNGRAETAMMLAEGWCTVEVRGQGLFFVFFFLCFFFCVRYKRASRHHCPSLHSQECRKGAAGARSTPRRTHYYFQRPPDLDLVGRVDTFVAEASALLQSPDLASTVWAALTLAGADNSLPSARVAFPTPPPPYSRRSWPRFLLLLPPPTAEAVLARAALACGDAAACISFLASRRGRRVARAGALWPIRDTLRDLMEFQQLSVRRALREKIWR